MNLVIAAEQRLEKLIAVFDNLFASGFNTRLLGGVAEPVYIPAGHSAAEAAGDIGVDIEGNSLPDICDYHRLYFREDYFSSALHEAAHWCIAGAERRLQVDFGYWYNPDGRTREQQQVFEQAEVKPQALEWIFSLACGQRFRISADNLAANMGASEDFILAVSRQAQSWCDNPMPTRGELFANALAGQFSQSNIRCSEQYQVAKLT
ncbi:MAG: elongation factor P hydroxylase [Porticoccaceae bacterium]